MTLLLKIKVIVVLIIFNLLLFLAYTLNIASFQCFDAVNQNFIYADISGGVVNPGLYKFEVGSRIADLLKEAGGLTSDVSLTWFNKNINLAQKLEADQKLYIPFDWEYEVPSPKYSLKPLNIPEIAQTTGSVPNTGSNNGSNNGSTSGDTKINVNKAGLEELMELNGIGKTYAEKLINNRPYSNIEDLKQKTGFTVTLINKFKDAITF